MNSPSGKQQNKTGFEDSDKDLAPIADDGR